MKRIKTAIKKKEKIEQRKGKSIPKGIGQKKRKSKRKLKSRENKER